MKRLKMLKTGFLMTLILGAFVSLSGCGGDGGEFGGGQWDSPSRTTLTSFSVKGVPATINEGDKTIAVTMPFGTDVTALRPTFGTLGDKVLVGGVEQTSAASWHDFTQPVIYTVTAPDGSTADYTVTVLLATNTAKAMSAYSFAGFPGAPGSINESAKTIVVILPFGTNLTNLVANFVSTGSSVAVGAVTQISGATANDFTTPVNYTVTAADGSTATYSTTVTMADASAKALLSYGFAQYSGATGTIDEVAKTIAVTVPFGTDVTNLVATYATTGTSVTVAAVNQTSTATANDFTLPVDYTVNAFDGSSAIYTVTVSLPRGPLPVNLRTAANFAILSKAAVSTTGTTAVVGDIGVSPAAASFITGFGLIADPSNTFSRSPYVTGKIYASNYATPTPANMTAAVSDMETAFTDAAGRTLPDFTELHSGDISGQTLVPGLYKWGTGVLITSAGVTLAGGPNDVWIFQIAQDLTVNNSAIVTLSGGAQAKNIFWQVAGQATLGTEADFKGNILSQTLISFNTGSKLVGRALAQTAVTLNASAITTP